MEGLCDNVIFGGGIDGRIHVWSSWDLKFLHKLVQAHQAAVTCMALV
jgi:hypothetical protein